MIRVLSDINLEPIKACFHGEVISFGEYNQTDRELLDPNSSLHSPEVDQVLLFLDGEEFLRTRMFRVPEEAVVQSVLDDLQELLSRLGSFLECRPAVVVTINTIALPPRTILTHINTNSAYSFSILESRMNEVIATFAARHPNVLILDWRGIMLELGYNNLIDDRFWYLGRVRLNQTALDALATEYKHLRRAYYCGPKKALVLDLDNTLWGGVLGEAGLGGIQLGEDGLGKAYRDFQQAVRGLTEVGVLLAIASKNNEADVLDAFRSHPMMVLRTKDFACMRVNWLPKPENLIAIARALNLGLESLVYIDDSAVERSFVRASVPDIAVPDFPSDPIELKRWLLAEVVPEYFGKIRITDEDRDKTRQYQANAARAEVAARLTVDKFLETLVIETRVYNKPAHHMQRIAQLIQKTNQFNLTGRRYSEAEIFMMYEDARWLVFALEYEDRFGPEGVVAAALVRVSEEIANIDSFVMSCRVIGRKVEYTLMGHIVTALRVRGVASLRAEYIRTSKNSVAAEFYSKMGFEQQSESKFNIDLSDVMPMLEFAGK